MKALSIRQPWAWLILHGGKDIENRSWQTNFRGRVLIHAPSRMTMNDYETIWSFANRVAPSIEIPEFEDIERNGIIGSVEIVDCIIDPKSPWYMGGNNYGWVLRNPKPLPFTPCKGQLGFFDCPEIQL